MGRKFTEEIIEMWSISTQRIGRRHEGVVDRCKWQYSDGNKRNTMLLLDYLRRDSLPLIDDELEGLFMLEITKVIIANHNTIIISSVLKNKAENKRGEDHSDVLHFSSLPIIVVRQALTVVVPWRCEGDQPRLDQPITNLPFRSHLRLWQAVVEELAKIYKNHPRLSVSLDVIDHSIQSGKNAIMLSWPRLLK